MENEEETSTNIVNENLEKEMADDIQNNNDINDENKSVHLESQITNNINNINIVNMIIEKDKRKLSNDSHESIKSNNTFFETKSKKEKKEGNNKIKNNYFLNNKRSFNKTDKSNKNPNYNLDISSIKELLDFQNKYIKNENNIVETNKCLQAYASMHPEAKINPIYFYILKNYQKEHKLNQNILANDTDEKYTPRKNIKENILENSNINTAETAKTQLNKKTKEIMELRKKITKIEEGNNNLFMRNTINYSNYREKDSDSKSKFLSSTIQSKKTKKENLHFKNDEELVKFVKNKFKEKNSYYLIELKNKSYITHLVEDDKSTINENNNSEINKLKSENKIIKNKNLKLTKDLEQIEKEMKLINEKNKELTEEINKKDSLIKKYEIKIKENRNQIQLLKKNISENNDNNIKEKNKNISTIKKEIELIILKNEKIYISNKDINHNKFKTEKIFSLNYKNEELKKIFDVNLSVINAQKFDLLSIKNNENKNNKTTNILEISKENDIIICQNKIETKQSKINNNFEKIFVETLNILGSIRKNNISSNFVKENIINFKFDHVKTKEIDNEKSKTFMNIEISKNFGIYFKGLLKAKQNLEIYKNENIYFEKSQKVQIKLLDNNLSIENIYNINFEKIKKEKNSLNEKLTFEHIQGIYFSGNQKIFEIKSLNIQKNQELQIKFIHNKKNINEVLSIEKTNLIIFNELKKISELAIVKNEIIFFINSKVDNKDIFKIINLDSISYKTTNNIINKFKNIEISKINISFYFNSKNISDNKNILPKNNTNNIPQKKDKTEIDNKKQKITNNLNKNSNNDNVNKKSDENSKNTNAIKSKENEQIDTKTNSKNDRLNRAMNRIKRKNQSKVESEIVNPDSFQVIENFRQKGRSDTVRYTKSGKIMDIAKKLEMQMTKGEDTIEEKVEENKNSNVFDIVSVQPIIKKKKKNKIIFNYED